MRPGFFLKEAFRALGRNAAPSLAAMLTVLLTALRERLVATPNVKAVKYISKAEALDQLEAQRRGAKEAIQVLGRNPLPATYRVVPRDPGRVQGIVAALVHVDPTTGKRTFAMPGIGDVRNREQDTNKILSATSLVKTLTASLAALLLFASIALIANTIRLSIFARRREVEVMTLVDPLSDRFALIAAPNTIEFPALIAVLLASCVAVSAIGSGLTLRRFLRV